MEGSKVMKLKAQISLELLIVFAIFLTVIIFSLSTLSSMNKKNVDLYHKMKVRLAFEDITDAANNVCVLGPGNVRKVYIPSNFIITYNGKELTVEGEGVSFSRYIPCKVEVTHSEGGTVLIKNVDGKVIIE